MTSTLPTKVFDPRHGRRQTDLRAWSCVERCRRKLGISEIPLPIPVEDWIEGPLSIRYGITDLSHLGDGVLGAVFIEDREIQIDERVLDHDGRARFTCAHELGHMMLHKTVRQVFQETGEPFDDLRDRVERQADRFAAAFLMPLPLLERELIRVLDSTGLDRVKCILELMKTTTEAEWLWRRQFLPAITRRFGVSLTAAINRCNDIRPRLPDSRPLLPFELIKRLLRPVRSNPELQDVCVVDGIPRRRDLFSVAECTGTG